MALLVPIATRRTGCVHSRRTAECFGGGVGDVNASVRWDFVVAGESQWVPGIALLAGVSFPSGKAPEQATPPLAVDATGLGAFQGTAALALEQTFGPWLVNATAMVAERAPHGGEQLGAQVTLLGAGAYTFANDMALALSASYAFEGGATASDGSTIPMSSRRLTVLTPPALAVRRLVEASRGSVRRATVRLGGEQPACLERFHSHAHPVVVMSFAPILLRAATAMLAALPACAGSKPSRSEVPFGGGRQRCSFSTRPIATAFAPTRSGFARSTTGSTIEG